MNYSGINDQAHDSTESFEMDIDEAHIDTDVSSDEYPDVQEESTSTDNTLELSETEDGSLDEKPVSSGKKIELDGPYRSGFQGALRKLKSKVKTNKKMISGGIISIGLVAVFASAFAFIYNGQIKVETPHMPSESAWDDDNFDGSFNDDWEDEWDDGWVESSDEVIYEQVLEPSRTQNGEKATVEEIELLVTSLIASLAETTERQEERIETLSRGVNSLARRIRSGEGTETQAQQSDSYDFEEIFSAINSIENELSQMQSRVDSNERRALREKESTDVSDNGGRGRNTVPRVKGNEIQVLSATEGFAIMKRLRNGTEFTLETGEGLRGWGVITRITALGCIEIGKHKVEPVGGEC